MILQHLTLALPQILLLAAACLALLSDLFLGKKGLHLTYAFALLGLLLAGYFWLRGEAAKLGRLVVYPLFVEIGMIFLIDGIVLGGVVEWEERGKMKKREGKEETMKRRRRRDSGAEWTML